MKDNQTEIGGEGHSSEDQHNLTAIDWMDKRYFVYLGTEDMYSMFNDLL
jgi:hypothetical protein